MIAALMVGTLSVWLATTPASASGDIRVALADGARTVELGGGPLVLQDLEGRRLTRVSPSWIRIVGHGSGVEVRGVGRVPARVTGVRVTVGGSGAVRVGKFDYPGRVEVRRGAEGLLVINALPLEDYVVGSVKAEAGEAMPLEMLKAQAIVARTYAAYHRRLNAGKPYEIVAATAHQQYAGASLSHLRHWE